MGKSIAFSYTLTFADGNNVVFDEHVSSRSALLPNFDASSPVPVPPNFHSAAAHAVVGFVSTANDGATPDLAPELYAMTLHLCDYLQMDQEVCRVVLTHLESPLASEDPLSRLRACHSSVPTFYCLLHAHYDMFETEEAAHHAMAAMLSKVDSSTQELTYYELSLLDGKYSPFQSSLQLPRFATSERERRQLIRDAAIAKTKALREGLKNDLDASDDETKDKSNKLRAALWSGEAIETTLLTKKLLDQEMWKAIEQGRVDVAQRLLDLGAEPAMAVDPHFDTMQEKHDHISLQPVFTEEMKSDRAFMSGVVKFKQDALEYASEKLKNDKEVVMVAVTHYGSALEYASEELKNDKEVVMVAVKQDGYALAYASEELKNDKEVVMVAVKQNGYALEYASEALKKDKEFMMVATTYKKDNAYEEARLDMIKLPSSLMLASKYLHMMHWLLDVAGVDVNMKQSTTNALGGFNSLWGATTEAMQFLLPRGIDPNQKCYCVKIDWDEQDREMPLLLTVKDEEQQKLLIRHGANPNCFWTYASNNDGDPLPEVQRAYWPNLLAQKNDTIDMKWCEELLTAHGANPNWPIGVSPNETGEFPQGPTVLLHAVLEGNIRLVSLLLQHGADPNQYEKPDGEDFGFDNFPDAEYIMYYHRPAFEHPCGLFEEGELQCPLSAALKINKKEMIHLLKSHGAVADSPISDSDEDVYYALHPTCAAFAGKIHLLTEKFKSDRAFMLKAVTHDGLALEHASDELKNDKEVVMTTVVRNGLALQYASDELKHDTGIVMVAVKQNGYALAYASEELKNDKEVVMAAVVRDGCALEYASDELKNDKNVVMAAMIHSGAGWVQDGSALEYASNEILNDKEFMMTAVAKDSSSLEYASDELKHDKEVVMAAVAKDCCALEFASDKLKSDKEVVLAAIAQGGDALEYASDEIMNDKEFMMIAVAQNSSTLEYASDELYSDKAFVMLAVKQGEIRWSDNHGLYANAIKYTSDELKNDTEVVMAAVAQTGRALEYASDELKNDKEIVMAAVAQNGRALEYASNELKNDKEIVMAAVAQNGYALQYASDEFRNDKEIVMAAVAQNSSALECASDELKHDKEVMAVVAKNSHTNANALER